MGHRVHSVDPRTAVLFAMAREEGVAGDGVLFMEALDTAVREKIKPLPINIDGALAAILHDLGFRRKQGNSSLSSDGWRASPPKSPRNTLGKSPCAFGCP